MQNKIIILAIALSIALTGCAFQTAKPANQATQPAPTSTTASSSVENKASSTVGQAQQDLSGYDITVKDEGQEKIITDDKYKFSFRVPADSEIKNDIIFIKQASHGEMWTIIATGTIESLNKGFFEEEGPIADSNILKTENIAVASGQIGQAFFYEGDNNVYSYSFLISVNGGRNIMILRMGYQGQISEKTFFKKVIATVNID